MYVDFALGFVGMASPSPMSRDGSTGSARVPGRSIGWLDPDAEGRAVL